MVKTFDLTGKVVAITGGYSYLGKSITESLLAHGAVVWVLARSELKHEMTFAQTMVGRERLFFCVCDISTSLSVREAFATVSSKSGGMDALINNAFFMSGREAGSASDDEWQDGVDGILSSTFRCIREGIPYLRKSAAPRIINIASAHGMIAPAKAMLKPPQYGVSKAGVIQLTKYYASLLGADGFTVNTVTPGPFPADRVQKDREVMQRLVEKTYLKRIGRPEDIGGAFVFLVSNAADYITGHNLVVDGGFTAG